MSALTKIMTGAAGLAAVAGMTSPAAAQYGYPYGGSQYGYGNNSGSGVIGAIIGAIGGGYGQYGYGNSGYAQVSDRALVSQCAAAVEARLNGQANSYGYGGGYGSNGYNGGGYNNNYGGGRVAGITRVLRRPNGGLKVYGVAMTNATYSGAYNRGYNNGSGYNNGYANGGYNGGYGQNGYAGGGYNGGYNGGNNGYSVSPDIQFNCKVDSAGRVDDIEVNRMSRYNRGDYYYGYRPGY